jgi:hypothetical protein
VNAAEITQDGDAGYILSVKSQNTCGLLTQARGSFRGWYMAMEVLMLAVIGGSDLG